MGNLSFGPGQNKVGWHHQQALDALAQPVVHATRLSQDSIDFDQINLILVSRSGWSQADESFS